MSKTIQRLRANSTRDQKPLALTGSLKLLAAESGKPRRFAMDAYNGGPMNFPWAEYPVIVDLAGLHISEKPRPILKDHDPKEVVGHSETIQNTDSGSRLYVEGVVSGAGEAAREVVESADKQFPWQASIGCDFENQNLELIAAGADVFVNQQTFTGPLYVVRVSHLGEVSFVALGADDSTAARMVAKKSNKPQFLKGQSMDFNQWLKNQGIDPETLSEEAKKALETAFNAETAAAKAAADEAEKVAAAAAAGEGAGDNKANAEDEAKKAVEAMRKATSLEATRIAGISRVCAGADHAAIQAKAIADGWSVDKAELEVLRASQSSAPGINTGRGSSPVNKEILEVAILQAGRAEKSTMKAFSEKAQNEADRHFRGRIGLQELLLHAAWQNGYVGHSLRNDHVGVLKAAFSSAEISGILSNVANKFLLEGFLAVDDAWRHIARIGRVDDFKQHSRYRLTADSQYEKVAPNGEIKHGTMADLTYTNQADTYGKLMAITRQDIINDDLGALNEVPLHLGRGAGLKLNDVFWTAFLNDAEFFNTDNSKLNYMSGAGTSQATGSLLSIGTVSRAKAQFRKQKDTNDKPFGVKPKILLVPSELEDTANSIVHSTETRNTTASTKEGTKNTHQGKFDVVETPYLSDSSYTGYSETAWYMLADPRDVATVEVAFLDGKEAPTIESADADFNTLGIQLRGFHDFGVALQEYRAGLKSKGAA